MLQAMSDAIPNVLFAVRIDATEADILDIEAMLEEQDIEMTAWQDAETGTVIFREYFDAAEDAERRLSGLQELLPEGTFHVEAIERKDWAEAWKEHFTTTRVSPRIVIKPSWETYEKEGDERVIELDPGMSFGTGLHFTTRSCLRVIDDITLSRPASRFVDLGCGSGILSIAALLLGCEHAVAVDNDPAAVAAGRKNATVNGVSDRLTCSLGNLAALDIGGPGDLVVANILANPLKAYAPAIAGCVGPGGHLVLAGVAPEQYPEVHEVYAGQGLRQVSTLADPAWRTTVFQK
jgi:ribosomal protein L11 methyltransferase